MGGYGSGRHGGATPKGIVEECLVLSAGKLQRDKMLREGLHASGTLTWTRIPTGEKVSSIGYEVDTLGGNPPTVRLHYTQTRRGEDHGEDMDYRVSLTTTPLPWGGVRWWFICPLTSNGRSCRRRCGKLYLPPGGRYFGCRLCYNLTYESSQEAHKFDRLFGLLAADTGIPPWRVKDLLKREFRVRGRRSGG